MTCQPVARLFLSTLSLRRATIVSSAGTTGKSNFYPRSPCGERQRGNAGFGSTGKYFYPRSPCGERQFNWNLIRSNRNISIHALLAESDVDEIPYQRQIYQFLSTLSLRRATNGFAGVLFLIDDFYPRSPCGERPREESDQQHLIDISIHALLAESDLENRAQDLANVAFLSTLSLRRATGCS